ncbi:MAG: hypothetical protein D3917_03920 [Candidatus Electrothrix sp. AX5]|nr:hypothetical protein [Candidatus Electrothrix sp. AX5]
MWLGDRVGGDSRESGENAWQALCFGLQFDLREPLSDRKSREVRDARSMGDTAKNRGFAWPLLPAFLEVRAKCGTGSV